MKYTNQERVFPSNFESLSAIREVSIFISPALLHFESFSISIGKDGVLGVVPAIDRCPGMFPHKIYLNGNKIRDEGCNNLMQIVRHKDVMLQELSLRHNHGILSRGLTPIFTSLAQ